MAKETQDAEVVKEDNQTHDDALVVRNSDQQLIDGFDQQIEEIQGIVNVRKDIEKKLQKKQSTLEEIAKSFTKVASQIGNQTLKARTMGSAYQSVKDAEGIKGKVKAVGSCAGLAATKVCPPLKHLGPKKGNKSVGVALDNQRTALIELSSQLHVLIYDKKEGLEPSVNKMQDQIDKYTQELVGLKSDLVGYENLITEKIETRAKLAEPLEAKYDGSLDQHLVDMSPAETQTYIQLDELDREIRKVGEDYEVTKNSIARYVVDIQGGKLFLGSIYTACKQNEGLKAEVDDLIERSDPSVEGVTKVSQITQVASTTEVLLNQYRNNIGSLMETLSDNVRKRAECHIEESSTVYRPETNLKMAENLKSTVEAYSASGSGQKLIGGIADTAMNPKQLNPGE